MHSSKKREKKTNFGVKRCDFQSALRDELELALLSYRSMGMQRCANRVKIVVIFRKIASLRQSWTYSTFVTM